MTEPLLRAARFPLTLARGAGERVLRLGTGAVRAGLQLLPWSRGDGGAPTVADNQPAGADLRGTRRAAAQQHPVEVDVTAGPPPPVEAGQPDEEEATLVAELAEEGAEDGAGAELEVTEPWNGYDRLKARDVIAALPRASNAALASIQLYERRGKGRRSVLDAAERELGRRGGR